MTSLRSSRATDAVALAASESRSATGTGDVVTLPGRPSSVSFQLDVTAAASAAADTLDVVIQTTFDGTNWIDVVAFTQVVGNGGTKRHIAKITTFEALAMFETGSALSAGSVRDLIGDRWRASWTIVDDTAAAFTFSVRAMPA